MSIRVFSLHVLCVALAILVAANRVRADTPPWWGDLPAQHDARGNGTAPADSSDGTPPHSQNGPVLEDYPVQSRSVATLERPLERSAAVGPVDREAASDQRYGIQPGDLLAISVWREPELTREVRVSPDGRITFPLVGEIAVEGQTVDSLRTELESRLTKFVTQAVVDVAIKEAEGNKIYVLGKVNRPGAYPFAKSLDVVQALSLAGGTARFAAIDDIKILRRIEGQQQTFRFRYSDVEHGHDLEQNIVLKSGDVIMVP